MQTTGSLFLVATPIGNLGDISERALNTLRCVDIIAAEDTRHTQQLLSHFQIKADLLTYHDHNDQKASPNIIAHLNAGRSVALVSDAGTPLISDPGYPLVAAAHEAGITVIPIPGACAAITALSASGLAPQPFEFIGFLAHKGKKREQAIESLQQSTHTCILYESVHRIESLITSLHTHLESSRRVCLARELTKHYESIRTDTISNLLKAMTEGEIPLKGEFVVIIESCPTQNDQPDITLNKETLLKELLEHLRLNDAVSTYCRLTGEKRNPSYELALTLKNS